MMTTPSGRKGSETRGLRQWSLQIPAARRIGARQIAKFAGSDVGLARWRPRARGLNEPQHNNRSPRDGFGWWAERLIRVRPRILVGSLAGLLTCWLDGRVVW